MLCRQILLAYKANSLLVFILFICNNQKVPVAVTMATEGSANTVKDHLIGRNVPKLNQIPHTLFLRIIQTEEK